MKNKLFKFISTVLVAILIVSIAPMNVAVVSEMKSSANSVIKNIGDVVENIDFTLPEFDVKAEALDVSDIPGASILFPPQKKPFTYEIKRKKTTSTLTITCSGEMPSYYGDTAPWSIYKSYENLVIKGDVENIGAYAFVNFTNLKKVTIDASVKTIGYQAFYGCTALTTVNLPDSLMSIYNRVFEGCSSLKKITIPENVTYIGSSVFRGCPLKTLTIPFAGGGPDNEDEAVTNQLGYIFGTTEFDNTYPVKSVTNADINYYIPRSLKTVNITKILERYNFQNCVGIEKIVIEDTVKSNLYPKYFAYGCTGLKSVVTNTDKIVAVGADAFRKCSSLENFVLPDNIDWIGEFAFGYCENLESITINDNIQRIHEYAFYKCSSLSNVEIPNTIFNINYNSFKNTPWFDSLTDEFCTVGDSILIKYNGTATDVIIPDGIKAIAGSAFTENENIKTLTLPESLKLIGSKSFFSCHELENLYIPDSVEIIEEEAFWGLCKLKVLSLPFVGRTRDVKNHTKEATFGHFFNEGNYVCNACDYKNNCVKQKYNANQSFYYTFHDNLKKIIVRGGEIKDYAFYDIDVYNIILEENVTSIGEYCFYGASIEKYTLNCNITEIPDYAFGSTWGLYGGVIEIPKTVERIGKAFSHCRSLKSVSLPEGVKTIDGSFEGCYNLASINLPESLEEIKGNAFSGCEALSVLNLNKNVRTIDFAAFVEEDYDSRYVCNISAVNVHEDNPYFYSKDGVLYTQQGELLFYPMQRQNSVLELTEDVTSINPEAKRLMTNVSEYKVEDDNPSFACVDGVLYNKDITRIIRFPSPNKNAYVAPENVREVSAYAFYRCYPESIKISSDGVVFEENCFLEANPKTLVVSCLEEKLEYYFGEELWSYSINRLELINQTISPVDYFAYGMPIMELIINGDFEKIGKYAFSKTEITGIDLPDSVRIIDDYAFAYSPLEWVDLGKSLEVIGYYAFYYCDLKSVELPESLTTIKAGGFGFNFIEEVVFPDNITHISTGAFAGSALKRIVINESILSVAQELFCNGRYLEVVVIGGAVEKIETKAFAECPSLKTVVIPDGVEEISDDAFENSTDNLTIYCNEDSYAETYAQENNIQYTSLVLDSIENQIYTGEEIRPYVGASANGKRLALDTEYTVDYKNNINAGSAKIIARGLGDFKALIAVGKFTILPKEMENIEIISQDSEFDPLAIDFKVDVFLDEIQLIKNVDYELVTESKLCDVGENNIAVCGIGNYSGITNITVNVLPRDIAKATIKTGKKVVVTDKGKELIKDIDYIETRTKGENGKEITEIKGIGNYDGAVICSENERISISFFDMLIEFIQSLIKMLMM